MTSRLALLGRFEADLCVRVVDVAPDYTIAQVIEAAAELTVDRYVRRPEPGMTLRLRRTTPDDSAPPLPPDLTVAEAGLRHFDCVDVYATREG
ncbi:toluene-4-monooxygenase system B family protein [Thermopolyspora sp. NPDC052614]|uniref:toluene-4-monooxygenase system B family protein n=1 Tax=Thermopolyspora sp. NPDC052614 TaxID=3155682 RepID=UPI003439A786